MDLIIKELISDIPRCYIGACHWRIIEGNQDARNAIELLTRYTDFLSKIQTFERVMAFSHLVGYDAQKMEYVFSVEQPGIKFCNS